MALEVQFQFQQAISELQRLNTGFEKLSRALLTGHNELVKIASGVSTVGKEAAKTERALSNLAKVRLSFSASNLEDFKKSLVSIRAELKGISESNQSKLGNISFTGNLTNTKAALDLQTRLNAEIEKQAKLKADIATLQGPQGANKYLSLDVENLKKAEAATARLVAEKRKLLGVEEQLSSMASRFASGRESLKQGSYQAQINAEERLARGREALAQGANQALINSEERLARVRESLKQGSYQAQINKETSALNAQYSAIDKLGSRLSALKGSMPISDFIAMKQALHAMNLELAKTGKVDKSGIASLSTQIHAFDGQLKNSSGTWASWSKSAKFAIGGIARSFGAMTYSYTMLAPLLAGMAIGKAIKDVYALGEAFEYSITFANALDTSIDKLSKKEVSDQILNFEGLRHGPEQLAEAVAEFERAGLSSKIVMQDMGNGMTQLEEISRFAALGQMDLAESVAVVAGQYYAFGESFVSIANKISVAAWVSATDVKKLSTAFTYTTELATVSKVTFSEVATAIALMANKGIEGSKAGTALRTSILRMQKPSEKLKGMLDSLGVSFSAFGEEGQVKNVRAMVMSLKEATENLPEPQRVAVLTELFGLRELKAGAVLLDSAGEKWDTMFKAIDEAAKGSQTALQKLNDQMENTVTHQKELLAASYKQSQVKAFDPAPVVQMLRDLNAVVRTDSFVAAIKMMVDSVNTFGAVLTGTLRILTMFSDKLLEIKRAVEDRFNVEVRMPTPLGLPNSVFSVVEKSYKEFFKRKDTLDKEAVDRSRVKIPDSSSVAFSDKSVDRLTGAQSSQLTTFERSAKLAAATLESIFREIDLDTKPLTEYEKALAEIPKKAAQFMKDNEGSLEYGGRNAEKEISDKLKSALDEKMFAEVQKSIDDLSFKNLIDGLSDSADASNRFSAKYFSVMREVTKEMKEKGQYTDDGGFTNQGQKYLDARLKSLHKYRTAAEEATAVTQAFDEEFQKLAQNLYGPSMGYPILEKLKNGAIDSLPVLSELDKHLIDVDKRVLALAEAKSIDVRANPEQVIRLRQEVMNLDAAMARQASAERVVGYDFQSKINEIENARKKTDEYGYTVDKVRSQVTKMQQGVYDSFVKVGGSWKDATGNIKFGETAQREFDAAVRASRIFEDTLDELAGKLRSFREQRDDAMRSQQSTLVDIQAEGMSPDAANNYKYKATKEEIEALSKAIKNTEKDSAGAARAMKLLEDKMAAIRAIDVKDSGGGLLQGRQTYKVKEYKAAMDEYQKLSKVSEEQIKNAMSELEAAKASVSEFITGAKTQLEEVKQQYQVIITEDINGMQVWKTAAVESVDDVILAWDRLARRIESMPKPKYTTSPSGYDGERALGGPVTAGRSYLVGEVGPEVFSPTRSGFIIPNDKLSSSREALDINLSFNGSEPVRLQGDRMSVDKLTRVLRENQRYAS